MFDWREFFPIEAIAPVLGGVLIWFGINYIYLAPEIIAPRLAAKYYTPACTTKITALRDARIEADRLAEVQRKLALRALGKNMKRQARRGTNSFLAQIFRSYGKQGEAFVEYYGDRIGETFAPNSMLDMGVDLKLNQQREALEQNEAKQRAALKRGIRHSTVPAFCNCVIAQSFTNKFDLATYTASLRLYTPNMIKSLEAGGDGSQALICGKPPIL